MPYAKSSLHKLLFPTKQTGGGTTTSNMNSLFNLMSEKKQFLMLTFANLIIQLSITYYVMENYTSTLTNYQIVGIFVLIFFLLLFISLLPMNSFLKFILFSMLSAIFGLLLSRRIKQMSPEIVKIAILGTIAIYVTMFLIGLFLLFTGIQLSLQFGLTLFYALLFLILFEIITYFMGTYSLWQKTYSAIALIIFSIYIIYDTTHILQRNYYGDFITASMDYYLDIMNIFANLLNSMNN
jgi:FtsH-binding integral membrane protein